MINPARVSRWHHALHQITGGMITQMVKGAAAEDAERWVAAMREIAVDMRREAEHERVGRDRKEGSDGKAAGRGAS